MFKELKISNFRGFGKEVTVRFAPITVLIGKNNAGKSSIIKFLLMLQQSLSQSSAGFLASQGDRIDLGKFYGLKNVVTKNKHLKFSLEIEDDSSPRDALSDYLKYEKIPLDEEISHRAEATVLYNENKFFQGQDHSVKLFAGGKEILNRSKKIAQDSLFLDFSDEQKIGNVNGSEIELMRKIHAERSCTESISYYIGTTRHLLPTREALGGGIDFGRSIPQRDVGQKGQYAMNHLWEIKDAEKQYHFILEYMKNVAGIEGINFEQLGEMAQCFAKNKKTGAPTNISEFGFGVSQSIPIFIQGAIMSPYTTLMVEQPEAQVHPTAQLEMGQFFADLWKEFKVGSIIETHSGNILLRLRRLIKKEALDTKEVSVAFFDCVDDRPVINNLCITQDGSLEPGLPMEFFGADVLEGLEMGAGE